MKFFCIPLFTCRAGIVESLDFSQQRLEELPKEIIKSRKYLEELLLNVNSIEELSPELFKCPKIKKLDVSQNKIKVIPVEVGVLQALEELNLSQNDIAGIPEEIGQCNSLVLLDVSTNLVSGLPKSIVNLSNLATLNLSNNSLTQLPQDIDRLVNLQFLDLAQCELRFLPPSIVKLERLKVLDLCDNHLTELPDKFDGLLSLEHLDLHCNQIAQLPEDILRCRALKILDLSGNELTALPQNFGDLINLTEVTLCENQISTIPHSIGQLKRLEILKAAKNRIAELTPAICSCSLLTDLILCENQLHELPSSLGNLRKLKFLDVSVNNLQTVPTTIGGCAALGVLALRHNQLRSIPMEIGRLEQLQVLDIIDNNLHYLPYTLTVLYNKKTLTALWLAFNQPPLPKLSPTYEPVMNVKVLTCYLLPQKFTKISDVPRVSSKSCVGGARVYFAQDKNGAAVEEEEEKNMPIGRFERYDTPHPKPFAPKNRLSRNSGDFSNAVAAMADAFAQHAQGQPLGDTEALVSARSGETSATDASRPLRSVLKRRPQSVLSQISAAHELAHDPVNRLSRRRLLKSITVRRGPNGIEWTIVGGVDSQPYKDRVGVFVSQLNDGGAAKSAGIRVDDRLLAINGRDLGALSHNEIVQLIHAAGDQLDLLIEREDSDQTEPSKINGTVYERSLAEIPLVDAPSPPPTNQPMPQNGDRSATAFDVSIARNSQGTLGFSIASQENGVGLQQPNYSVIVTAVAHGGAALGKLQVGDRLVAVDGVSVKSSHHDQVVALLSGQRNTSVRLTVERDGNVPMPDSKESLKPPLLPSKLKNQPSTTIEQHQAQASGWAFGEMNLSRSLPSLLASAASKDANVGINGETDAAAPPLPPPRPNKRPAPLAGGVGGAQSMSNLLLSLMSSDQRSADEMQPPERLASFSPQKSPTSFSPIPIAVPISSAPPPPSMLKPANGQGQAPDSSGIRLFDASSIRPLATSSPVPAKPITSASCIPVPISATSNASTGVGGTQRPKPPPPVAPKPKMIPEQLTFSSKLKKFEEEISSQQLLASKTNGSAIQRPSGIPMKKPLVSAQDLEKLRAEEVDRRRPSPPPVTPTGDEHRDTLSALANDFGQILTASPSQIPTGPSIIRTRKAELRAERAASTAQGNGPETSLNSATEMGDGADSVASLSRASSSLSQRASELEKRQAWRAARLQSMDVESKRTDDLVKLISSIPPSPIPIQSANG